MIFLLFGTLVFGETLVGKVIKVYDGDTITILMDGVKEKIRFYGVDAAEIKQSYGIESRDFIRSKIKKKGKLIFSEGVQKSLQIEKRFL